MKAPGQPWALVLGPLKTCESYESQAGLLEADGLATETLGCCKAEDRCWNVTRKQIRPKQGRALAQLPLSGPEVDCII